MNTDAHYVQRYEDDKLFKGESFVRNHIENKHGDVLYEKKLKRGY